MLNPYSTSRPGRVFPLPAVFLSLTLVLTACGSPAPSSSTRDDYPSGARHNAAVSSTSSSTPNAVPSKVAVDQIYTLGTGDRLRVNVYGEPDLSGEFEIDGTGSISLPLIGETSLGGRTVRQAEQQIEQIFKSGYLTNPRVSIEVINFRPFYIVGEVNNPGSYPYVNGMTVLNAVALSGGYTPRALKRDMLIRRSFKNQQDEFTANESTQVLPGDSIEVRERWF